MFEPLALIERLCALIPRPRRKLVTYHGVFASAAGYRHRVVPAPPAELEDGATPGCAHERKRRTPSRNEQSLPEPVPSQPPTKRRRPRSKYSWAELLRRVFLIDVLTCPRCGGKAQAARRHP